MVYWLTGNKHSEHYGQSWGETHYTIRPSTGFSIKPHRTGTDSVIFRLTAFQKSTETEFSRLPSHYLNYLDEPTTLPCIDDYGLWSYTTHTLYQGIHATVP
jgi:hypothetical protein